MSVVSKILIWLGILIAVFGIGVDYLLPGAEPGLNLPQLLFIAAGLALSFGAHRWRRALLRRRTGGRSRAGIFAALLSVLVTLVLLELLLTAFGSTTYFPIGAPETKARRTPMRLCDESGCRFNYEVIVDLCARGEQTGRWCVMNRQGFPDHDDFVIGEDFADRTRILMLGDSFTQGFSAAVGHSFVETIEARNPDYVVWNGAVNGTGTNQAIASFEMLAPTLKPDLTVLGFVTNDFFDNLMPIDSWYDIENQDGNMIFVRPFRFDPWDNVIPLDAESAEYFLKTGVYPPLNDGERLLGSSRLGTYVLRLRDALAALNSDARRFEKGIDYTRDYLRRLRDITAAHASELLVLVIPRLGNFGERGEHHVVAVNLMEELGLPYIALIDILDQDKDYVPPPDGHWNTAGHQKVGALLSACIRLFAASGRFDDCDQVVTP